MGPIREFNIVVDDNEGEGKITDPITGRLVLLLNEDITVTSVSISLLGSSECEWRQNKIIYLSLDALVVDIAYPVLSQSGSEDVLLKAGDYSFPFSFSLQHQRHLPSSFQHKALTQRWGKIGYKLAAEINRKGAGSHDKTKTPVNIVNPQIINPELLKPHSIDGEGTDGLCFASGAVKIQASVDKTGLSLFDDECHLTLTVDNLSKSTVTPKISLVQKSVFVAEHLDRTVKKKVVQLFGEPIPGRTKDNVSSYTISLAGIDTCGTITTTDNITVTYAIMIKLGGSTVKEYILMTLGVPPQQPESVATSAPPSYGANTQY